MKTQTTVKTVAGQRGGITMGMTIVLLALISIGGFATYRSIASETLVMNNGVRAQQAFEAAEAGLSAAIDYLSEDWDRNEDGIIDPVFDTVADVDNMGDTNSAAVGNGRVQVTTTDVTTGLLKRIQVTSQGFSDDATASRTVSQIIAKLDPLPRFPGNPLSTRSSVTILGSSTIINPEGNTNIWSGEDVDLGSNNSTATEIADPQDPNYPFCMETAMTCSTMPSSNKSMEGSDIVQGDSNLENRTDAEFFEFYFGLSPSVFRESHVTMETTGASADTDVQTATEEVIWVEGDVTFTNNTTIGCESSVSGSNVCSAAETKPSILIIDGNVVFKGTPKIYGIVFVFGNIEISGSTTVTGALVAGGSLLNKTSGSLEMIYNTDVLTAARLNGSLRAVSGTWKDFL